ncbi:P-loop NTPase fold protein [Paenibacillus sp. TC-CSREp1]|uniref:P-loop NTPase fold protein n=1 Tax=Paenibacillus sp. TC-CSREp1 TaxID=3410089 RepID=UPI003CFA38C8
MVEWMTDLLTNFLGVLGKEMQAFLMRIVAAYGMHKTIFSIVLVFLASYYILISIYKYRDFKWRIISHFVYHILFVCGIGWLLLIISMNIKWVETFLKSSPLIILITYFIVILYVKERILYWKTKRKLEGRLIQALYFAGLTSVPFTIVSSNWEIVDCINLISILFILFSLYNSLNVSSTMLHSLNETEEEADQEIKNADQLFPTRKRELERIKRYITLQEYQEPFALAINAAFGEGKSSLIQVLTSELKKDKNKVVFLKPTITDTREKLINFFFRELEVILKESGIYTGKGSAIKKYVEQFGKLVENNKIDVFVEILGVFENEKTEEFRETKRRLEEDIHQMLLYSSKERMRRLYIVVDDFDRVEKSTMLETLIFIKELVDFKYCGVLFLMNYNLVIGEKITHDYLDKFIGKRFDLEKVSYRETLTYYLNHNKLSLIENNSLGFISEEMNILKDKAITFMDQTEKGIVSIFDKTHKSYQEKLQRKNKEGDNLQNIETQLKKDENELQLFQEKINNPRRLKRILRESKEALMFLDRLYQDEGNPYFAENAKKAELHRIIFNIAMIKYLFEEEYELIIKSGNMINYLSKCESKVIKEYMLYDISRSLFKESEIILQEMKIKLYHVILFQRTEGEEYLQEIITKTEHRLSLIDKQSELLTDITSIDGILPFIEAIKNKMGTEEISLAKKRLETVFDVIISLLKQGKVQAKEILELFNHKTITVKLLAIAPSFLDSLSREVASKPFIFGDNNEKIRLDNILDNHEQSLIQFFIGDIGLIITTSEIVYKKSYLNSFFELAEGISNLKKLNNTLEKYYGLNIKEDDKESVSDLDWFENYVINILDDIKQLDDIKPEVLKAVTYCQQRISLFLKLLSYNYVISDSLSKGKFSDLYDVKPRYLTSLFEVEKTIVEMRQLILTQHWADDLSETYQYFYDTIIQINKLIGINPLSREISQYISEIYEIMDMKYNGRIYEELHWRNCGLLVEKLVSQSES